MESGARSLGRRHMFGEKRIRSVSAVPAEIDPKRAQL